VAEVTMSLEEYLALVDPGTRTAPKTAAPKPKRKGKKDPKMARALKKANSMGRKKDKSFKKGWDQGKIMSKAHQLRRKM